MFTAVYPFEKNSSMRILLQQQAFCKAMEYTNNRQFERFAQCQSGSFCIIAFLLNNSPVVLHFLYLVGSFDSSALHVRLDLESIWYCYDIAEHFRAVVSKIVYV